MRVFHKAAGSNSSASSPPLSQSRGNAGWRGHLEAFSLTSRSRWDGLQRVIDSAVALSGQVLETYGDGAGYCTAQLLFALAPEPYLLNRPAAWVMHLALNYLILQVSGP